MVEKGARGAGLSNRTPRHSATCTLSPAQMEEFQIYEKYCQNKPRSESLWRQCSDCPFFQVCLGTLLVRVLSPH